MASSKIKKMVAKSANKSYLAKDFESFRNDLLIYAKTYFPDKIQDFSETSLGGLFLDMAAYIGDSMAFYLDYQFNELNPFTAIEISNIESHIKNAGIKIPGAAPASVPITFYINVAASKNSFGEYTPDINVLPIIEEDTILRSSDGINFSLVEALDFREKDKNGKYMAFYNVFSNTASGVPEYFTMHRTVDCVSGNIEIDTFSIPNRHQPFRTLTLSTQDVSEIISVRDDENDEYYEVSSLTQDTVYKKIQSISQNGEVAISNLEIIPAPRRFVYTNNFKTRLTTLQFGSGDASSLDDDIIPDLSELSLPLYGKKTFSRFSIDPNSLLKTQSLGISPKNTTLTVVYRAGGGLSHNVAANSIMEIIDLSISFPRQSLSSAAEKNIVLSSLSVINEKPASGGANPIDIGTLRSLIPAAKNQQSRIVTFQDLLARIYSLPSTFGQVFRVGIRKNPNNPLATQLYILSKDINGNLTVSPDALKRNLSKYLNEFRLISDAIDVLDGTVITYGINFAVVVTPMSNKSLVISEIIASLRTISDIRYFQIDQPLIMADFINAIINTPGVLSLTSLEIVNKINLYDQGSSNYSDFEFDILANTHKGLIFGPPGSIFELKFPDFDIVGSAE